MFAAEPREFLPATHAAFGGEMRSSYFQNTPRGIKTMFDFLKRSKKEPENVKEILEELKKVEKSLAGLSEKLAGLEKASQFHFQKIGFIRYNPFSGVGSDQSFSLALLDNNNNGIVITSLFSREGNRVYAKIVEKGESSYALSEEEKQALKKAIESNKRKNDD